MTTVLAVCDTETTGFSETDQVLEIAVKWLCGQSWDEHWTQLIRPEVPVTPGARATHHISDDMLYQPLKEWLTRNPRVFTALFPGARHDDFNIEGVVFAAHYAEFDLRMLRQSRIEPIPSRVICTWKCSQHLYPTAESHSLQSLRYELELDFVEPVGHAPHRALYDAVVCAALLHRMIGEGNSIEHLEELTKRPVLLELVKFGKYRGQRWADMDTGYLRWILSKNFDADVHHTAQHHLDQRR